MAKANERRIGCSREMATTNFSSFSRDLLRRFTPASTDSHEQAQNAAFSGEGDEEEGREGDREGEIELNLGLSLGGRYGIDKSSSLNKLKRSSSIVGTMPIFQVEKPAAAEIPPEAEFVEAPATGLTRTTSLPVEKEEECKKRKEMQTLRRMEAKKRRSEKQRNNINVDRSSCGLPRAAAAANKGCILRKHHEVSSRDSQGGDGGGGSFASVSEFESKSVQGSNRSSEARSPVPTEPSVEQSNQEGAGTSSTNAPDSIRRVSNPVRRLSSVDLNQGNEKLGMVDMPCVFTKGEGPNAKRVGGILYRYGKGEEVRIMCVCHGIFLSPAEFVRHAGGGDVDHPLRHIVVNASAATSSLL